MTLARALLILLGGCASCALLVRGFRPAALLLLGAGLASAGLVRETALQTRPLPIGQGPNILAAIELATAVSATLIFFATGSAYQNDPGASRDLSGRAKPRRTSRRNSRRDGRTGRTRYALPLLAVVLLVASTVVAPRFYPYASREIDYAWTLLMLSGVLSILVADNLLKLGVGLILLSFGLKLFYLAVTARVGLTEVALLNVVTLMLALIVAYLSALLYVQRNTLRLEAMYDRDSINDP